MSLCFARPARQPARQPARDTRGQEIGPPVSLEGGGLGGPQFVAAFAGKTKEPVELRLVERGLFRGGLDFHDPAAAGQHEVRVGFGVATWPISGMVLITFIFTRWRSASVSAT